MNYPASLDTPQSLYVAVNNKATTLVGTVAPGNIDIGIVNASGLQATGGLISIGDEVIKYSTIDNTGPNPVLMNCTRGFDGTTAATHSAGARVEVRWVAAHHNVLTAAIIALQTQLGLLPLDAGPVEYTSLTNMLDLNLPLIIPMASSDDWSFTHNRKRICSVQLWRLKSGDLYERFDAGIEQQLNPLGVANVSILLGTGNDKEGFLVVQ